MLIFLEESILRVLVDARLVLDGFGTVRIVQGAQGLIIIVISWRKGSDHNGLGVTTEGVLEQTCQLGVTIGNVLRVAIY